ncbi:MAG: helix-turn-helix transcriptional regulator [Lachnospiraceae bacterium]|nr:helix-turn-helix transcriptional regulator [Lachnospiraceae bacterium]MBR0153819.1 helix-turn-helix transcriptional regulator [Lachnospiraceae bacterium]
MTPTPAIWENDGILFRINAGSGELEVNGLRETLRPGMYGLLLPYQICRFLPEETLVMEAMKVDLLLLLSAGLAIEEAKPYTRSSLRVPTDAEAEVLDDIWHSCEEEKGIRIGIAAALANRLIRRLALCAAPEESEREIPLSFRMMEDLAGHLKGDLRLEASAGRLGCSPEELKEEAWKLTECSWEDLTDHLRSVFMGLWVYNDEVTFEGKLADLHFSSSSRFYHSFYRAWSIRYPVFADWLFPQRYHNEYYDKDQRAFALLSFLEGHMLEDVEELRRRISEQFAMTPRYADRLLRYKFGASVSALLKRWRTRYAANLLVTTDRPLEEIALASGFGSVHTLKRQFFRRFRQSPVAYREKNRKEYPK